MKIFQYVDFFSDGDGIGNDIKGFRNIFDELGIPSHIIARINHSELKDVKPLNHSVSLKKDDIHILHYGGAGFPYNYYDSLIGKKIIRFHNLTPVNFFKNTLSEELYSSLKKNELISIIELESYDRQGNVFLHPSKFNYKSMYRLLNRKINSNNNIIPILKDYSFKSKSIKIKNQICYVGRIVPNKKIEHFIFLMFYLKKISTTYKLLLIGKVNPVFQDYYKDIIQLIDDLELKDSIHIFHDLDDKEVDEKTSASELFVSMSEHEGFGIPILDAIANHTLVFAFYSSAIIEIMLDSGIYFYNKNFPEIAKTIHELLNNSTDLDLQIQKQKDRLSYFQNYPFLEKISALVNSV